MLISGIVQFALWLYVGYQVDIYVKSHMTKEERIMNGLEPREVNLYKLKSNGYVVCKKLDNNECGYNLTDCIDEKEYLCVTPKNLVIETILETKKPGRNFDPI